MNATAQTTGFATSIFATTADRAPEITRTPDITAFLASWGFSIAKKAGRWTISQNGAEIDAPQRTRRDAQSTAVAYALGYMN